MTNPQTSPERILFLDNIRYLMVILVIIFHAAISYCSIIPWWSVVDTQQNELFDVFILISDAFQLPVLFFISGYFVLPSLRRQKPSAFVVSKLKRFGIPLVILGLFYTPVIPYIRHVLNSPEPLSYVSYWLLQLKSLGDFSIVRLYDDTTGIPYANHISHWHLWFISLLLCFLLITAAVYYCGQKFYSADTRSGGIFVAKPQSNGKILLVLGLFGLLMALGTVIASLKFYGWEWVRIGSLLMFQPTRIPLYSGIFILGIYANHRQWFHTPLPGHYMLWLVLAGILSFALLACMVIIGADEATIQPIPSAAAGIIRILLVFSMIFAFMNFGQRRWNSQGYVGNHLSLCSYELYLLHLPIVILVQYAILPVNASPFVKFGIAAVVSLGITITLARLFVLRFPKWSTAGLLTGFMLATLFVG